MNPIFIPSLLSQCCLLALASAALSPTAQAGNSVTDGSTLLVTSGYTSSLAGDYPLLASGAGSLLQTSVPLTFRTSGNNLFAARILDGGEMVLSGATLSTSGLQASGLDITAGLATLRGGLIATNGINSSAVAVRGDSQLTLADLALVTNGNQSVGIDMRGGTLQADNVSLVINGSSASGIALGGGVFATHVDAALHDVSVLMQGAGTQAAIEVGNAQLNGDRVTLNALDQHRGVEIYNPENSRGVVTLSNSTFATESGDAVYLLNGDITLNNSQLTTQTGIGVNVNKNASALLNQSSVTTSGYAADAVWIAEANSHAQIADSQLVTRGSAATALNAQYGPATIINSELETSGSGSYGIYTQSQVDADGVTVTTTGASGMGVFAAMGGKVNISNSTITTAGELAAGLLAYPASGITGDRLTVTTTGDNGFALWVRSAEMAVSNSTLTTQGNAAGLYLSGNSAGDASLVRLDNTALISQRASGIQAAGAQGQLALSNGTVVTGGSGTVLQSSGGSQLAVTADRQVTLNGDVNIAAGDQVTLAMREGSTLTGAVQNLQNLTLDDSVWNLTGNSVTGTLSHSGTINFVSDGAGFHTLNLSTLNGSGHFVMNTDIAGLQGDLIAISGDASGAHQISVRDSGREPADSSGILPLVHTAGGSASFSLTSGVVDAGVYQYEMQQRGDDWVLAAKPASADPDIDSPGSSDPLPPPPPAPGTDPGEPPVVAPGTVVPVNPALTASSRSVLALSNVLPVAADAELSTQRTRAGEIRSGQQQGGVWLRTLGGETHQDGSGGTDARLQQSGVMIGVDSARETEGSTSLFGLFTGVSHHNVQYSVSGSGKIDSYFIGAYNTWLLNDGWFVDVVAKANNFNVSNRVTMSGGEQSKGGFSTPGFTLSLEAGRHIAFSDGWFIEPSALVATTWIKGQNWQMDNGMQVKNGQMSSKQGELKTVAGRSLTLANGVTLQPWLQLAVINEFASGDDVNLNGHGFRNDRSGLRGEAGAGIAAQIHRDLQVYSEVTRARGANSEQPWGASLGVRWSW